MVIILSLMLLQAVLTKHIGHLVMEQLLLKQTQIIPLMRMEHMQ
jgi:hypothetical protein